MKTPTSIKLDDALKTRLQHLATAKNRSLHWLLCEAVREYVEREEREEAFYQHALQSWENYQKDGLHLTGDEVIQWLRTSEPDTPPPLCHS